ncbi:MAG: pro-sigmaK processing inhibitor BofA family protein [Oscillospiraceae bacterium]|jgi:hypothetical protein|nr:pro-sigmaK processing inhibitor BofA family protein [Oscillospiraceae bacterium]
MSNIMALLLIFVVFLSLVFLQIALKSKKPIKKAFFLSFLGVIALIFVNITSFLTSVSIPVSLLSIGIAIVMGIPGITTILLLNMIFF